MHRSQRLLSSAFGAALLASATWPSWAGADPTEAAAVSERALKRAVIYFDADSHALSRQGERTLERVIEALLEDRERVAVVATSTTEAGGDSAIAAGRLDVERARSIETYLVARGVSPERVIEATSASAANRPREQRVMIFFESMTAATSYAPERDDAPPPSAIVDFTPVQPAERVELRPDAESKAAFTPTRDFLGGGEFLAADERAPLDRGSSSFLSTVGVGLSLGGGVTGFVDSDTRAFAGRGGAWDARVTVGTRMPVAIEASYFGSANQIEALGLDDDAYLVGNGFEGDIRIALVPPSRIQPYLLGGFGWTHFQLANAGTNTSSVLDSDGVFHAPVGAGVSVRVGRALLDVRGLVRPTFDDVMLEAASDDRARLSTWGVLTKIGIEL